MAQPTPTAQEKKLGGWILLILILAALAGGYFLFKKDVQTPAPVDTSNSPMIPQENGLLSPKQTLEIAQKFIVKEELKEEEEIKCLDFDGIREGEKVLYAVSYIPKEGCTNLPHGGNQEMLLIEVNLKTGEAAVGSEQFLEEKVDVTIESIKPSSAKIGASIEVSGTNFAGFEGDKNLWIENSAGKKGIIYGMYPQSTNSTIFFKLENKYCTQDNSYKGGDCEEYLTIVPGTYSIYVLPWGNMSNKVKFTVTK